MCMEQDQQRKGPLKRKTRKQAAFAMDYDQTMIPGQVYQSWLKDASDISSRRRRKKRKVYNYFYYASFHFILFHPKFVNSLDTISDTMIR